jgi:hypothetical protein
MTIEPLLNSNRESDIPSTASSPRRFSPAIRRRRRFRIQSVKRLAGLRYDGRHHVGAVLARELIDAAELSVGRHHSEPYALQVR